MPQDKQLETQDANSLDPVRHRADELVSAIGRDTFFSLFSEVLGDSLDFEFLIVFLYRKDAAPARLHDSITAARHRRGLNNYLKNTYVLNPFYQALRKGVEPGVYFMKQFTPAPCDLETRRQEFRLRVDSYEEIGFLTEDWPSGMQELLLVMPIDSSTLIEVSLSKKEAGGGFTGRNVSELRNAFPFFHALIGKHWEIASHLLAPELEAPLLERLFIAFGQDLLSERERQVIRLVLLGHSSTSIALNLDVALPTVKSHRRNAYAKLGISSQAELFALFMSSVHKLRDSHEGSAQRTGSGKNT